MSSTPAFDAALRIEWSPDTDGTGALTVTASDGCFAGRGSAWFNRQEVDAFGVALRDTFPLQTVIGLEYPPAGYRSEGLVGEMPDFALRVYPVGSTGQIGIQLRLAAEVYRFMRPERLCRVLLELQTDHEALRRLGAAMVTMLQDGGVSAASLVAQDFGDD